MSDQEYTRTSEDILKTLKTKALFFKISTTFFFITTIIFSYLSIIHYNINKPNISKWEYIPPSSSIEVKEDISVNGKIHQNSAAEINGKFNHKFSPYFSSLNYYDANNKISSSLQILPNFRTYQQSTPVSCGDAAAFMALRYLGIDNVTEYDLFKEANTTQNGTNTIPLGKAITKLTKGKVNVEYPKGNEDITIEEFMKIVIECTDFRNKCVLLLENIEAGGHWMTLIGYDNMNTEITADDVLIFADPFDTKDHNQDGYFILPFEKYYSMWFDHKYLEKKHNKKQYVKLTLN